MANRSPQTDRLIAAPPSALAGADNLVWLHPRRVMEGEPMKDLPAVATNPEGMLLLREMATDMRQARDDIAQVREVQAEWRGANLPSTVQAHGAAIDLLKAQMLEMRVAARPAQFALKELAKSALGALVGAIAALIALGKVPHG
jgi:hypothetical protein